MKLMLLDTYGLVYRAFFALPPLTTTKGVPINAAYGFTMMLNKLLTDEKPTHVIAAFDKGMPAERLAMYKEYKAQRDAMPDELRGQFALVRQILATFDIPIVEMEGQEADDVIATLARQVEDAGEHTIVVTGDLDLLQLVDDFTTVLTTRRGITDLGRYDVAAVRERFGLEPSQLPDYRGLKGDPSDNLPGIPGVGEKTATKLLQAAGSLDALVANPALAGTAKLQALIEQYGAQAQLCRTVSIVRRDLPLPLDRERQPLSRARRCRSLQTVRRAGVQDAAREAAAAGRPAAVRNREETRRALPQLCRRRRSARVRAPGRGHPRARRARSVRRCRAAATRSVSAPPPERASPCRSMRWRTTRCAKRSKKRWRTRRTLRPTMPNASRARCASRGVTPAGIRDDAMIAAHLLDPSRTFANIADAAAEFLRLALPDDAAAHADATLQMLASMRPQLEARGQLRLYEDVEVPLAPILASMEAAGVAIDPAELGVIGAEIDVTAARLAQQIFDFAGETFNLASPQQLGNVLFGKLQIPGGKKNKTGWATGVEVLQGLAREYPICALVLEWREVTKLKNTYIDVIPSLVDARDGRLRTAFNQTATATGRLSSTNPNLQNIPGAQRTRAADPARVRLRPRRLRSARRGLQPDRTAADGASLGRRSDARAFEEGQDIHDFTARQIFDVAAGAVVDGNQRRMAKSVNFGLLYGMSDFGLAQRLEIGRAEAKEITQAYFARFPSVRAYIERTIEEGRRDGYVSTILGRRRYMPGLASGNYMLRAAAEREATNAPLQGSAADLMKLAMVRVDRALADSGLDATMLLQIHDELIFEVRESDVNGVANLVRRHMEEAIALSVPLEVTLKTGRNWYEVAAMDAEEIERV